MKLPYNLTTKNYLLSNYNLIKVPVMLPLVYFINQIQSWFGETHV